MFGNSSKSLSIFDRPDGNLFYLRSQSKPDAGDVARISTLERDIAAATTELEELQDKSGTIEKAIKDLNLR